MEVIEKMENKVGLFSLVIILQLCGYNIANAIITLCVTFKNAPQAEQRCQFASTSIRICKLFGHQV